MNGFYCLVLGALFVLSIDANDNDSAECTSVSDNCNIYLPQDVSSIVNDNNEVDVDCSTLESNRECLDYLEAQCQTISSSHDYQSKRRRFRVKEHLCTNAPAFVNGKSCWESNHMMEALISCGQCTKKACLENRFKTVAECSDIDAVLLAGIADRIDPECEP